MTPDDEVQLQRAYYARTADQYDAMHLHAGDEHHFALAILSGLLDYLAVGSVLDVGSGTGRALRYLKARQPGLRATGIEPVAALREAGYASGLSETELVDGDATALPFEAECFDLVCAFGVLHHIRHPERAVSEMLRVSRKAIFISDANNYGQGSAPVRLLKQVLHRLGLWKLVDYLKTGGKGYSITEGDGLAYSYSVFNNYRQIRAACKSVHLINTKAAGYNFYASAEHLALLGLKQ